MTWGRTNAKTASLAVAGALLLSTAPVTALASTTQPVVLHFAAAKLFSFKLWHQNQEVFNSGHPSFRARKAAERRSSQRSALHLCLSVCWYQRS